jgi:hypothetical protein
MSKVQNSTEKLIIIVHAKVTYGITEKERLMLVKNKETICGATLQVLRLAHDP